MLSSVSANGRATSTTLAVLGKGYLELNVSSTYVGEPATAIVTDKTTGLPVENVGLEIFADEVTPITRETEPYTIDSPGTYIFTLDNADYFYEEIALEYTIPPTTSTISTSTTSSSTSTSPTQSTTSTTSSTTSSTTIPSTTTSTSSTTSTTHGGGGGGGFFGWLWGLIMWFFRWLWGLFRGFFRFFGL